MHQLSEGNMITSGKPITIYLSLLFSVVATLASAASLNNAQDVADYVFITRYDQTYGSGTLGKDWCLNIEHDWIAKDWWYMELANGDMEAIAVYNTVRIPTYYVENGIVKVASILMGVGYDNPYMVAPSQYSLGPPSPSIPSVTAVATGATVGDCFNIKQFIESRFLPLGFGINPSTVPTESLVDKNDRSIHYVYWRFQNVSHRVYGVTKIPLKLVRQSVLVDAFLLVGYGGGAGP
jgi:hypothetical protein